METKAGEQKLLSFCNVSVTNLGGDYVGLDELDDVYKGIPFFLILNVPAFVALFITFLIIRAISWNLSKKKEEVKNVYLSFPTEHLARIRKFESFASWLKSIFVTDLDTIETECGEDARIYLHFQIFCIIFLSILTVASLGIILPLNFSGEHIFGVQHIDHFQHSTLGNISSNSHIQWVHFTFAFLIFVLAYELMHSFKSIHFVGYEDQADLRKNVTLMFENVQLCEKADIKGYLEDTFKEDNVKVKEVTFTYYRKEVAKIRNNLEKVERALAYCRKYPESVKLYKVYLFCGTRPETALEYYKKREKELRKKYMNERKEALGRANLDIVFVTFQNLASSSKVFSAFKLNTMFEVNKKLKPKQPDVPQPEIAVKPETLKPETWNCSYAAPPDDINWENLTNSKVMWYLKSGLLHGLILFFVVFLTTPKHAAEHFDEFLYLTLGKAKGFHWVLEYLSEVWILAFSLTLPEFFSWTDKWIGYYAKSTEIRWNMIKSYAFLVLIIIIMPTFGMTYLTQILRNLFKDDISDANRMWQCFFLADSGANLIRYTIMVGFLANGFELIVFLIWPILNRLFIAKSRADMYIVQGASEFKFGENYTGFLLMFTLTVMFSLICPLITPFGLFYAVVKHFVDKNRILYEFKKTKVDKSVHICAMKLMIVATLLQLILMVLYSIVKNTGEIMKTLNGFRELYITVLTTIAITFFAIEKFSVNLPYRKTDLAVIEKLQKQQFEKTHDYVYQNYKHNDECTAEQFCA